MGLRRFLSSACVAVLVLVGWTSLAAAATPRVVPGQLIVKYRTGTPDGLRSLALATLPQAVPLRNLDIINAQLVTVSGMSTAQAIAALQENPNVEYAEPNYVVHANAVPNDARFSELYGMLNTGQTGGTPGADIRATNAWDVYTGDPNIKIGVIDTGIDYTHPDLVNNVWTNPGEIAGNSIDDDGNGYVDDIHGYDFVNNDGDPMDDHYHGTHCSGTIAGEGNNSIGVAGVNWHAKLIGIKFLDSSGSGSTAAAISSIQYAVAVHTRLTSNSWGGGGFSQALLDAINAAGADNQLFVAAAGNASTNTDASPSYPASYDSPYIISVAATDHNDQLASFSNYGLTTVDLGAPGVDILSCQPGGGYQLLSGTSMATPHVAGACGLVWGRLPNATNLFIKELILTRADPIPALAGRCVTGARLNVFMSLADPDSIAPGQVGDLATTVPGSTTMGLAWTATGDDTTSGRAARYEIRYSLAPINDGNWSAATLVSGVPSPQPYGSPEAFEVPGLTYLTTYYFALKAFDEFGNAGPVSNNGTGTTLGIPNISVTPSTLTETLLTGATSDQVLTVANTGAGRLDWTAPTPEVLLAASRMPVDQTVYPAMTLAKDELDPRPGLMGSGGPDAFGYRWKDSDDPAGPAFSWVDITGVGTNAGVAVDDGLSGTIALPFNFPYYGSTFSSLRVCSNGFVTFTGSSAPYSNSALPSSSGVANMVAPFWDDLSLVSTGTIYTYYDGSRFIIEWAAVPHYSSGGPYTFEAILYPTGEIRFQYLTMGSPTNSASLGIQNATMDVGLNVAYNATYLHDNMAVRIIPLAQWMTVSPTSGRIAAGNSLPVTVHFDAAGLVGGTYLGNVRFLSNDPDDSPELVPTTLTVIGAPNIVAAPETTAFGQQYVGGTYTRTLVVTNNGTDSLRVTNIASSDASLAAAPFAFVVAPSSAANVTLTWHPTSIALLNATLDIASNDPDSPTVTVRATGDGVAAPSFSVNPTSFEETLNTNSAVSRSMRITNGGGSNLNWSALTLMTPAAPPVPVHESAFVPKGAPDVETGPVAENAGGPDAFGYRWADSREVGGPTYEWVDISGTGTAIAFNGDDQNLGPFPIGFSFPFYGTTYTTFRACTNGWLSFTSSATSYSNTALPNNASGTPENLVAAFWDDMTFSTLGDAYYLFDGQRLIVQWQAVPRLSETPTNTFEVILYPDGRIIYQYQTMGTTTTASHTIGIQNATKSDGLQMVYNNASFIANNLAVRITPPATWLTVTPPSGTIAAGGYMDLTVGFNAAGLFGGDYNGTVRINSNDPVVPQYDIPALLHVIGVPDVAVTPDSLPFDTTFVGGTRLRQLTVQNTGTSSLIVDEITFSNPAYSTTTGAVTIPPLGSVLVPVSFSPVAAASYPGTLTVKSNDPDTPQLPVPLTGAGAIAPDQVLSQSSLALTMAPNDVRVRNLVLQNVGGSNLYWSVGASVSGSSMVQYEAMELAKGQTDPRPGILGSGGPDAAGYRWKDSDDPSGPVFGWVDITGVGTAHPELLDDDRTGGPYAIGFNFPFYGGSFGTVNIGTNGYLSFTAMDSVYSNQPLPTNSTGTPANLVAPFWDDLTLASAGAIYTYNDGTRFIVAWVGVPAYNASSGGPFTFEAILYPSGKIVYQYLTMGTSPASATVGIQNATKDVGLQVAYNAAYIHDNLAVQLTQIPTWLTTTATTGTVLPGGSVTIPLTINTTGVPLGVYNGNVRITSNDPDESLVDFPVELTVSDATAVGGVTLPAHYGLRLSGRNPSIGQATLELAMPARGRASVAVYDAQGALVRTLADGEMAAGYHPLTWRGERASGAVARPGMYFVRAITAGGTFHQRLVYLQ